MYNGSVGDAGRLADGTSDSGLAVLFHASLQPFTNFDILGRRLLSWNLFIFCSRAPPTVGILIPPWCPRLICHLIYWPQVKLPLTCSPSEIEIVTGKKPGVWVREGGVGGGVTVGCTGTVLRPGIESSPAVWVCIH